MKRTMSLTALLVLASATLVVSACAGSNDSKRAEADNDQREIPSMTWEQAKAAQDSGAVLVDARGAESYAKGHIPGAVRASAADDAALSSLPADKATQLVMYCGGPQCSASTAMAKKAIDAGYTAVAEYKGGYPEWAAKHGLAGEVTQRPAHEGVSVMDWEQVSAALSAGAVLVDARGADGYAKGHIEGAINVPCKDEAAFSALPEDKATTLIFYCGGPACSASTKGAVAALDLGYTNVAEYRGGYPEWASKR